ncbi:MAG: DNA polymerase I [Candidatus Magasanikbacteria bacterium CG10_big_fil_rev_8_21_14_0_10_47_10]|uniref:DNA polymerase I n=1 Tax=Candidatus Magasanikbacteria bacterium CG10_big_fil_rev_8_21_14_0_10_47_10 TaxID=1974652 RepID=A0A2H0TRQ8_9BACT|nr:MAG: DNA polymerase I [Candidatus Magasanikbacteria bacterium CG10_big_fil_rev_8_21_14_0_10_47_10]
MTHKDKQLFVIIDGHAIIHRAYHALPPLTAKDGTVVNAVFGFSSMLLKVLSDLQPSHIAVSFDMAGGTFRDEIYDKYKATRVKADQDLYDQIPLVHDVVGAFNIPIYEKEGFEADDIIGTIVTTLSTDNSTLDVVIVTGDKDMLQLVDTSHVQVALLTKGMSEFTLFDERMVQDTYGFGPTLIPDYKALMGDPSDNIPGVSGIGKKTGAELIQKIGSVEKIYGAIDTREKKPVTVVKESVLKKLENGKEDALMSLKLATIEKNVKGLKFDLKKCVAQDFDVQTVKDLFHKYEFFSLIKRIPGMPEPAAQEKKKSAPKKKITLVDHENAEESIASIQAEQVLAAIEMLSSPDVLTAQLLGFVVATAHATYVVEKKAVSEEEWKQILSNFLDRKKTIVGHDLKQLIKVLELQQISVACRLFDTMIASYVVDASSRAHDLPAVVLREFGEDIQANAGQSTLFGADPAVLAEQAGYIRRLHAMYTKKLDDQENLGLFEKIEMALIPVLARMELWGIGIDEKMMGALSNQVAKRIDVVTKKIYKEVGHDFNVASSAQLRDVLFHDLGLSTDTIKKGKTGYSTAASELEKLRGMHPIIELIEEHRELAKLQNTYTDVLPTLVSAKTGRIHTSFNQAVASTGRLSSSNPNLQNIPIRTELGKKIRDAFVAAPGFVLVSADYSQIELRIVASLAQDTEMMEIFKQGEDIHTATAAAIAGVPLSNVTKEMRRAAKEVNFGVLYGMGAYGLAWRAGISQAQAKEFIEKYFSQFQGVKKYLDQTIVFAKEEGYVETLLGRRRYIPELRSTNFQVRSAGERMAINMPVQGTAADLMKLAMIEVDKEIRSKEQGIKKMKPGDVRMLLQVHDEIVLEVKKGMEKDVEKMVRDAMVGVANLRVPIEVEVHHGKRWGELK